MGNCNQMEDEAQFVGDRQIAGTAEDRAYARCVADWCEREVRKACEFGRLETRPFVQNVELIIAALREYADRGQA
jgi:hypothetical protein